MRKTPLRRIGKIGKRNLEASAKLRWIFNDYGITSCELGYPGCTGSMFTTFAHKDRREDYRSRLGDLHSFSEVILACQHCHEILDNRSKTTKEQSDAEFKRLRENRWSFKSND